MPHSSSSHEADLEPFRVEVHPERDSVRVAPVGELDLATVDEIHARLRELNRAGSRRLVLDLRRLTFIDSSGVRLLLTWDAAARQNGIDFTILEGPPAVQRVFELAGLLDQLPFRA